MQFVFVQRPYADRLPKVENWLRENFFDNEDCLITDETDDAGESSYEDGDYLSEGSDGDQSDVNVGSHGNGAEGSHVDEDDYTDGGEGIYDDQGVPYYEGDCNDEGNYVYEDSSSSVLSEDVEPNASERRDASYLINNSRTEVVLSGIPCARHESVPSRTWGSMFQLHRAQHSASSFVHLSLPNISEEFGLRNRVGYTVEGVDDLSELQRAAVDEEETGNVWYEYIDSVSVAAYKNELREQARWDAARGL